MGKEDQALVLEALAQTDLSEPHSDASVESLRCHATVGVVCDRYRAWLDGAPLPPLASVPTHDLPSRGAGSLPKLLARDDRVMAAHAEACVAPLRERARREQLADVSLRSTITFVLGAIEPTP